jgi:hypothetical protein
MLGQGMLPRPVFTMNFERNSAFSVLSQGTVALIEGGYKYIHYLGINSVGREDELFNLMQDPNELSNLIARKEDTAATMRAQILGRLREADIQLQH